MGNKGLDQSTNVLAPSQSAPGSLAKLVALDRGHGAKFSQQNHFAVIKELMDEETDLIGANKEKATVEARNMANLKDGTVEMDVAPPQIVEA
ncbi:hypothetical protein SLE2022_340920 [Rubroshorea leprosula]